MDKDGNVQDVSIVSFVLHCSKYFMYHSIDSQSSPKEQIWLKDVLKAARKKGRSDICFY
jgi:hypothetical protein